MSAPKPDLNYAEISLAESVHQHQRLYRHYASLLQQSTATGAATQAPGGNSAPTTPHLTMATPSTIPIIPSLPEQQRLLSELEALLAAAEVRENLVKANLEIVSAWLKRGSTVVPAAVAASPPTTSTSSSSSAAPPAAVPTGNGFASLSSAVGTVPPPRLASSSASPRPDIPRTASPVTSSATSPNVPLPFAPSGGVRKIAASTAFPPKSRPLVPKEPAVKLESEAPARPPSPPQNAKKRKREADGDGEDLALVRKSDDGSVKIAISQNGKMKIKLASSPPPPSGSTPLPPQPSARPQAKAVTAKPPRGQPPKIKARRKGGLAADADDTQLNATPEPEKKDDVMMEGDYSKARAPPNQIPITHFWGFLESQYFRPLNDDDFAFLDSSGDDVTPFVMPALGRHYLEQWAEEDGTPFDGPDAVPRKSFHTSESSSLSNIPMPLEYEEIEETVLCGEVFLGSLAERILASLGEERLSGALRNDDDEEQGVVPIMHRPPKSRSTVDMAALDDRLRSELKYIGLLGDDEVIEEHKDTDEISDELRRVQAELRQLMNENNDRKQQLKRIAAYHRGYEQYCGVLDAISKQIEADYSKRMKQSPRNKKQRKTAAALAIPVAPKPVSEQTVDLIEKRRVLVEGVGSLFPAESVCMPLTGSIFNIGEPKLEE
ncbi:histone acetyltransferases subunit 3-domain-containing protein [Zopfochytrium polystomum]|nr:histone acetyltransferases subunit 3-domain-containing protein [Zopfochytrium polystomum]